MEPAIRQLQVPTWRPDPTAAEENVFRVQGDAAQGWSVQGPDQQMEAPSQHDWLTSLERRVSLFIGRHAQGAAFIHAGSLAWQGRGVLLPGRSHAGKSTLVHELVERGARFLSDEYAILDPEGRVHPYPRRLSLRQPQGGEERLSLGDPQDLSSVPAAFILHCRYQKGSTFSSARTSPGQGSLHLTANAVAAQDQPALVLQCISRAARQSACWEATRGEASAAADWLLNELSV